MLKLCGKAVEALGTGLGKSIQLSPISTSTSDLILHGRRFLDTKITALCPESAINPHSLSAKFNLLSGFFSTVSPMPINTNKLNKRIAI